MKKIIVYCFIIAIPLLFCSCMSKEKKAEKLIKEELAKTLYDFDSYMPVETTVSVAKSNMYNDSACWYIGNLMEYGVEQFLEYKEKLIDAQDRMALWGHPTSYSSSYSDSQYRKSKKEAENAIENELSLLSSNLLMADSLEHLINSLDTSKVIGWEATHHFRCKTRGGDPEIGHFRYIISPDFKRIILFEDMESSRNQHIREIFRLVLDENTESILRSGIPAE